MKYYTFLIYLFVMVFVLSLISCESKAEPFAEISLSVRQPIGKQGTGFSHIDGTNIDIQTFRPYDVNVTKNPYVGFRAGYNWHLAHQLMPFVAYDHESSAATSKDRGINDFRVGIRWSYK